MTDSYFLFGAKAYQHLTDTIKEKNYSSVFVIVDSNTEQYCLPKLKSLFSYNDFIVIPAGEQYKTLATLEFILQSLRDKNAGKDSVLINLGGGMVSDVSGLAASLYMRGIDCINIPTTLLAMVDAAIGGKTGVNSGELKNIVGSFHLPEKIVIDISYLKTLPERQIHSGYGELIKHAVLKGDAAFFKRTGQKNISINSILESAKFKVAVTDKDQEDHGLRRMLNFGHTIGHAIESYAMKKNIELYHGEAIALGMIAEFSLCEKLCGFEKKVSRDYSDFIMNEYSYLKSIDQKQFDFDEFYHLMTFDKKNKENLPAFSLLSAPGKYEGQFTADKEQIAEAIRVLQEYLSN